MLLNLKIIKHIIMKERKETYDFICFSELAYEWDESDREKVEIKLKNRINKITNQKYNQNRVDYIRLLRNELFGEISLRNESKYFINNNLKYADLGDFDSNKMLLDFMKKYDQINETDLLNIIEMAIFLFYVR